MPPPDRRLGARAGPSRGAAGSYQRVPRVAGLMSMNAIVTLVLVDDLRRELTRDDLAEQAVGIAHAGSLPALRAPAGVADRLLARGDLARVRRLLELRRSCPTSGPGPDSERAR